MRLVLVRHGRTASNVHRLLDTAHPGADLDEVGHAQASALVERLADLDLDAVYASTLVRTQQTAAPLARARGLGLRVLPGLREIAAGDQELWPFWQSYVGMLSAWASGDLAVGRPGGETGLEFFERFDAAVAEIVGEGHHTALLVSHGAALKMWVGGRVAGVDRETIATRPLGNTAAVVIEGDPVSGWTLIDWHPGDEMDAPGPERQPGRFALTRAEASEAAPGWRHVLGRLELATRWPTYAAGAAFVARVADLAERLDHHPDLTLGYRRVTLALSSQDVGGVTHRDTAFARQVSAIVDELGGAPTPERLTRLEVAIDTLDADAIRPFWAAVLAYEEVDGVLHDPDRLGPAVWFQHLDEPRPGRNRLHLDVSVAHDEAPGRLERALASGGRLVSDAAAPAWWVLADADGNEACLSTWQGRDA